jgi:hypothetical protein
LNINSNKHHLDIGKSVVDSQWSSCSGVGVVVIIDTTNNNRCSIDKL